MPQGVRQLREHWKRGQGSKQYGTGWGTGAKVSWGWQRIKHISLESAENHEERGDAVGESRSLENKFQPSRFPLLWSLHTYPPLPLHPSSTLTPTHHPPALCTPPQKSSDSWKVLGVYSVTTKQNHLKTKWAGECAGAIRPFSFCGRREKRPLRIKGIEGGQGEAHHFNPQVIPLSTHQDPLLPPPPLHPTHTHTFKCTLQRWTCYLKQSCLCYSTSKNKILPLLSSLSLSLILFSFKNTFCCSFPISDFFFSFSCNNPSTMGITHVKCWIWWYQNMQAEWTYMDLYT